MQANVLDDESDLKFVEELKQHWMATVDAIRDPLMIVSKDYRVLKLNRALAELEHTDIREAIGQPCYKIFAGRNKPCSNCQIKKVFKSNEPTTFELEGMREGMVHEVTAQPMILPNNELEGILTIYRDRTEAKELQAQLMQSEKLASIGLLAGGIAHEINNPLGGILIFSQMMLREMEKNNPHYQDVVEIENAALRCKDIIQNLLDFARSQPKTVAELEDVNIEEAILSAIHFVMVGANRREIKVIEEWSDRRLSFRGTHNKVIQLFLNIIQNAVQAMPRGGILTLSSKKVKRAGKEYMAYCIEDTGKGIEPSELTKIFDPFYTSKDPGEGTGLGLSICHSIVKDMKGLIEATSIPGESTMFKVLLPISSSKPSEKSLNKKPKGRTS